MKTGQITYVVGPHHGEYELLTSYAETEEFDFYTDEGDRTYEEFLEWLGDSKHELDLEDIKESTWGTFTRIIPKQHLGGDIKEHMNNWYIDQILGDLLGECFKQFLTASGDDSTFDYVPSFIESIHQLCRLLGKPELVDKWYAAAKIMDPDYPEFFPDEDEAEPTDGTEN